MQNLFRHKHKTPYFVSIGAGILVVVGVVLASLLLKGDETPTQNLEQKVVETQDQLSLIHI